MNKVTVTTLLLSANLLQALPLPCAASAVGVAFVPFRQSILFRIQEAVHIISNVRLEVCDYSAS